MKTSKKFLSGKYFLLILFTAIIFSAGCSKDDNDSPGTNEVWMQSNTFKPSSMTVSVNTTITWTNKDGTNHTVTSDSNLFDSGNLSKDGKFSFTFSSIGTFP